MTQIQLQPVKVSEIVMTAGTQMRSWMNTEAISEYAALMKEGVEFDPIEVYLVDDKFILVNGFHRVNAAIKAQLESISALITVGTLEQALWASIAANKKNALKRNTSDIQRAIEAALLHPNGAELSDRQIADHVGCSHPTVGSARAKLMATGKLSSADVRKGKDGRSISTAAIGKQHQMEQWQALVYKPWIVSAGKADLYLIHNGDEYLDISLKSSESILSKRYHLEYNYFSPHGSRDSGSGVRVDKKYVKLFEADDLNVYIQEFADLPELMQRVAKAAFNEKGYSYPKLYKFGLVDPALQPGDKAAKIEKDYSKKPFPVIGSVIGVSQSFIHARRFGSSKDEIWYGGQLAPLETALRTGGAPLVLNSYYQWVSADGMKWIDEFAGLKAYYAPESLLLIKCQDAFITFGDDAVQASATNLPGISGHDDKFGPVFITFDQTALTNYAKTLPVAYYEDRSETLRRFWQNLVAVQARPPAPAPAPEFEDRSTLDELEIDEQLAEQVITDDDGPMTHPGIPSQVFHDSSQSDQAVQSMYVQLGNFGFDEIADLPPALERMLLFINGLYKPDETVHESINVWRNFLNRVEATIFESEQVQ